MTGSNGGLNVMVKAGKVIGVAPLPHYEMPDGSIPPYKEILEQVQRNEHHHIGVSYYYIHATGRDCTLCRIIHGGGKIYFHELVDHEKHGISEDDISEAVRLGAASFSIQDYYPISPHIEQKLRLLYEE